MQEFPREGRGEVKRTQEDAKKNDTKNLSKRGKNNVGRLPRLLCG